MRSRATPVIAISAARSPAGTIHCWPLSALQVTVALGALGVACLLRGSERIHKNRAGGLFDVASGWKTGSNDRLWPDFSRSRTGAIRDVPLHGNVAASLIFRRRTPRVVHGASERSPSPRWVDG